MSRASNNGAEVWRTRDRSVVYRSWANSPLVAVADCLGFTRCSVMHRRALDHIKSDIRHSLYGMFVIPTTVRPEYRTIKKLAILMNSGIKEKYSVRHIGNYSCYRIYTVCLIED